MKLNHVANRVSTGHLELILECFTSQLGFSLLRRIPTDIWLRQPGANVDIQFCETGAPRVEGDKHNSHISFLTSSPEADLKRLADWFHSRGIETKLGSWSEKEFYLDAPGVFVDFAIEAMTPDLAEYGVDEDGVRDNSAAFWIALLLFAGVMCLVVEATKTASLAGATGGVLIFYAFWAYRTQARRRNGNSGNGH